jgi:uncharacterized protein (TIGR02246 family)
MTGYRDRSFALKLVMGLALCALLSPIASRTSIAAEANPMAQAVVNKFHAALKSGDKEAALRLLDDGAVIFESGYAETKKEYAAHHLASDIEFAKGTQREIKSSSARCSGSNCLITETTETTGRYKDKPVKSFGVETAVLEQKDGAWRIVHVHWSSHK